MEKINFMIKQESEILQLWNNSIKHMQFMFINICCKTFFIKKIEFQSRGRVGG
jgi:hypothetical protein